MSISYDNGRFLYRDVEKSLPFKPEDYGFEISEELFCCLYFERGDQVVQINKLSAMSSLRIKGSNRVISADRAIFPSDESFKRMLSKLDQN